MASCIISSGGLRQRMLMKYCGILHCSIGERRRWLDGIYAEISRLEVALPSFVVRRSHARIGVSKARRVETRCRSSACTWSGRLKCARQEQVMRRLCAPVNAPVGFHSRHCSKFCGIGRVAKESPSEVGFNNMQCTFHLSSSMVSSILLMI